MAQTHLARLLVFLALLLGTAATTHHRATWINVWLNENQAYVPAATGRARYNITCAWDVAIEKYNISLPSGMTLNNTAAIDWTGGDNYGNMFAMLSLIQLAGMDMVIPDFTNGFGMSNSKFPVEQLHSMLHQHFPEMRVAYAVSAGAFVPALAYLEGSGSDTSGYLTDEQGRNVIVIYSGYDSFRKITDENPGLRVLFANGESIAGNKAGWHNEPFSGYRAPYVGQEDSSQSDVFWVAPSLDWQPGHPVNATWSVSLPWLAYGLEVLDAMESPPWLTVMGSFDDIGERNMWMPALTAWGQGKGATDVRSNSMVSLDGKTDGGVAAVDRDDWTVFYDTVRAYFTEGRLPQGRTRTLAVLAPVGVGEFMLGVTAPAYTLFIDPPYPFNRTAAAAVGGGGRPLVRCLSATLPPGMLFPASSGSSVGSAELEEFSFMTGTESSRPLSSYHLLDCHACGLTVCEDDYSLVVGPAGTFVTTSKTLVLPNVAGLNYSAAVDLEDCNLLRGPGVAFVTSSSSPGTHHTQSTGILGVPLAFPTQSLVYTVPVPYQGEEGEEVIIYALATGEVFAASADFARVELVPVRDAKRHLWTLSPHPAAAAAALVSIADDAGDELVWQADTASRGASIVCSADDCLYGIRLAPSKPSSLLSAFAFQ